MWDASSGAWTREITDHGTQGVAVPAVLSCALPVVGNSESESSGSAPPVGVEEVHRPAAEGKHALADAVDHHLLARLVVTPRAGRQEWQMGGHTSQGMRTLRA